MEGGNLPQKKSTQEKFALTHSTLSLPSCLNNFIKKRHLSKITFKRKSIHVKGNLFSMCCLSSAGR